MKLEDWVSVEKLDNGLWAWICQPDSGAFYRAGTLFKRKADAVAAGLAFAKELV